MKKLLPCLLCILLLLGNAFAQTNPAPKNSGTSGPIVEMEPYIVKGDRVLPNPEQWHYVKVPALVLTMGNRNIVAPGYEMLSNLSSKETKVLVDELQLRQLASTRLWPSLTQVLPRTPVYIVVDINQQHSGPRQFVKTSDTWDGDPIVATNVQPAPSNFNSSADFGGMGAQQFSAAYGLSQMDELNADMAITGDVTMAEPDMSGLTSRNVQQYKRDETVVRPLPDGFVELATNGGPLAALVRAGGPRTGIDRPSQERFAATISYQLGVFALNSQPQKLPAWFTRGFGSLLGSTQVSHKLIEFAKVREDLARRSMPKLSDLLQKDGAFTEQEARLSSLLVHFGLFGDNGKYSARFMQFVNRIAQGDQVTDAMFKEVFGMSLGKMETHLGVYGRDIAAFKSTQFKFDIPPPMPPATYREATQAEAARIKSEVYISQANPGKALEELRIAYWRGEREPAMLASLATLEQQAGSEPRARKLLNALMQLPKPPAQTYIVAAKLQLQDTLAAKKFEGALLTAEETSELIATLSGALAGGLTTEDLCGTLAEVITKSSIAPDSGIISFLREAAKRFPKNKMIAKAIQLGATQKI